jgi:hypothetical protein
MSNSTQLPIELQNETANKAAAYAEKEGVNDGDDVHIAYLAGATEYATKLHMLQKVAIESDKQRKEANDGLREAKKLLNEVFRKHESGLLPDRFVYDKIKKFLYGE